MMHETPALTSGKFDKVRRMPAGPPSYGMVFGNVLHACLERYLEADDSGRGPDGQPVDVFPPGWFVDESGVHITPEDQELIPKLIDEAITEGMLDRLPGRKIEEKFTGILNQGEGPFGRHVFVTGKIDVSLPDRIVDHKGTKKMRYALSPERLGNDLQMLLYAKVKGVTRLQHNVFDRTEGRLRKTVVDVTPERVEEQWQECKELGGEMLSLAEAGHHDQDWRAVPGALDRDPEICAEYGGCRFLSICQGYESPGKFRQRHFRMKHPELVQLQKRSNVSEKKLSLEEKIAAAKARAQGKANPVNPAKLPEIEDPKAEEAWGDEERPAQPTKAGAKEEPVEEEKGKQVPTPTAPHVSPDRPILKSRSELRSMRKAELLDYVTTLQKAQPSSNSQGLKILRGCVEIKGGTQESKTLTEVFRYVVEDIAGDTLEVFYGKDPFKRRDVLKTLAKQVASELGPIAIVAPMYPSTDERELLAALSQFASAEVVGCG